jgi:hypothetical protein
MATTTHSPAPWVRPTDRRDRWICSALASGARIGVCMMPKPSDFSEDLSRMIEHGQRIAADMALIAAAPELLAALEDVLPLIADTIRHDPQAAGHPRVQAALAAIAKAKDA